MDTLAQQVRRARRRLSVQQFLRVLCFSWFALLLASATLIALDKYVPLGVTWWGWIVGALGMGVAVAAVWTLMTRASVLDAAWEIDHRCGLRERLSSSLALSADERASSVGQALIQDAIKRVERLELVEQFPVRLGRWALLPLGPGLVAFVLAVFWQPELSTNQAVATTQTRLQKEQIKKSSENLRKQLEDRKKQAEEKGLKDAEDLFAKLERDTRELTSNQPGDRKQALVKLNDLAKELEKRRQNVGAGDQLKQQLEQLKNIEKGPADKLVDALQKGDMKKALGELNQLRDQMAAGKMDAQAQEQLAKQLEQMQKKVQDALDAQQKAKEELEKRLADASQAGRKQEADDLQKQLDKLEQKMGQNEALQQMANQLGKAAQSLKNGDQQQAAQQLQDMAGQLAGMQEQLEEAQMLADALDQIAQAKDAMNCKQCAGEGCQHCKGNGQGMGQGDGQGEGDGLGKGRGKGFRPENKTDTASYDTNVKQKVGKGAALVSGFADGPNAKGKVQQAIKTEWESVRGQDSDPLSGQHLPRGYRDHAKKYFDALRTGEK